MLSEAPERSRITGQRLAWERARLGVVGPRNIGTRLIATHELVIRITRAATMPYLFVPATSQSALLDWWC